MDAVENDRRDRLAAWIAGSPDLMTTLRAIRDLELADGWVMAGAVYQTAWNGLTGRAAGYGVRDFDIGYFDPDLSWEAEDRVIRQVAGALPPALAPRLEVRNQARVHLWFEDKFASPYPPLGRTTQALERYTSTSYAVGARVTAAGGVEIAAPFGLSPCFSMILRPNPNWSAPREVFLRHAAKAQARWPELVISPA